MVAAIVAGVISIGAVTVGVAHAYYGSERATALTSVRAPIDWVPAPALGSVSRTTPKVQPKRPPAKPAYIPTLPDLGGISPKSLHFQWPVVGYHGITSPFGPRDGQFHHGADIACGTGQPLFASRTGRVVFAGDAGDVYGNAVAIDHGNTYMTVYGHMTQVTVKPGDVVRTGHKIGTCGMTGNATGPHVHFEIRYNGYVWDPMMFLP
jgi:murein DD-endopeptidase MepM/ murein hydrolase activator NlpD